MQVTVARFRRIFHRRTPAAAFLFPLLLAVAGCETAPLRDDTAVMAAPVAQEARLPAGAPRFVVDRDASEVRLLVFRAGPLARVGHNHVITGRISGEIRAGERAGDSGFRLEIPVESFVVDSPPARAEEGEDFAAEVSDEARRATRANLLGADLLEAARYPLIEIDSIALEGPRWNPTVVARARLHGTTRDLRFAAAVLQQGDVLTVIAGFRIRQTDFGLTPYSLLNGALQVRDAIDVRLRIVARRAA